MTIFIGIALMLGGFFLLNWWVSVNNKGEYYTPMILNHHPDRVLFGYLVWLILIIYGFILLLKVNVLLPVLLIGVFLLINRFVNKNDSLDSQIVWVFKMYIQEKRLQENSSKNEKELLLITAKRYLSTTVFADRYYLFEESPSKDIKEIAKHLMLYCHVITVPDDVDERLKIYKILDNKIDVIYDQCFPNK